MKKTLGTLGLLAMTAASVWPQLVPQPDKDGVYPSGARGSTLARLIHGAEAVYPSDPSLAGIQHVCALHVVIGADGVPGTIQILNEKPSPFDDSAIASVKQSQFQPATYQGKPVPTYLTLWVPFNVGKELAVPIEGSAGRKVVSPPMPLNSVEAEYPRQSPGNKLPPGVVTVRLLVTEKGLPADIRLLTPAGNGFDESALKAVRKYLFKPATLYGVPVPYVITVQVNFRSY
jgi:TonB family protein